ncbi:endonuclease/exonuclease/phosphatase family protein [Streptomonospora nanhaiensis]|uniref:endonuclease/exonuclease/phosphatase family protein n=1 Tax=Streptomonospora nanhaiensis TaxID=1323731 RepID=UPI001C385E72|nr:endonuclease/exonuclease/phosphatase family protein [Streptomonospora nanhaiensis]MBV2364985.1 endonuclease/exonuclease/phosphatase family protein [Streptomonospora nanhaiensis]
MPLTIMSLNLRHGGTQDPHGQPDDRWPAIAADIATVRPDILCLQECHGWSDRLGAQLYRAERDLGMQSVGIVKGRTRTAGNALLYRPRPGIAVSEWATDYEQEHRTGLAVALFKVDGLSGRLAVAGVHLTTTTAEATATEAMCAATRVLAYDGHGVLIGDFNAHPASDGGGAPHAAMVTPLVRVARYDPAGHPIRTVGQALTRAGMVDAAHHLASLTGDVSLYGPTGRSGIRVDQAWLTPALSPHLTAYQRVRTASDHDAIVVSLGAPEDAKNRGGV